MSARASVGANGTPAGMEKRLACLRSRLARSRSLGACPALDAAKASGPASAAEDHQFGVGEVAGRRGPRTLVVTRLALGEITPGEAGNGADGVGDDEKAAVAGETASVGGAEAREVARFAAIDQMDAGDALAPDPPRLEDERPRLVAAEADEGVAAERGMVGEQARVARGQQRRLRSVGRVCDDARARLSRATASARR